MFDTNNVAVGLCLLARRRVTKISNFFLKSSDSVILCKAIDTGRSFRTADSEYVFVVNVFSNFHSSHFADEYDEKTY